MKTKSSYGGDGRYIDEAIKTRCMADMISWSIFPNAKEVTESMAAYSAVRTHLREFKFDDPSVVCVCVGDGSTPRTAALFAMRSAWSVISADPRLKHFGPDKKIDRLFRWPARADFSLYLHRPLLIVGVHSHAPIVPILVNMLSTEIRSIVMMPCCVKESRPASEPDVQYDDMGVWSPKRTIMIWRNI